MGGLARAVRVGTRCASDLQAAHKIGNSATLLGVILAMFERHPGELAEGWFDAVDREYRQTIPEQMGSAKR